MASWMAPSEIGDLRSSAENAQAHGARLSLEPGVVLALIEERERLRAAMIRQQYDVTEALAQAMGMEKDPLYGYPTGDHTAETLALSMIDYCARLREGIDITQVRA